MPFYSWLSKDYFPNTAFGKKSVFRVSYSSKLLELTTELTFPLVNLKASCSILRNK